MATVFSGLPAGVNVFNVATLPLSNILEDTNAGVLRKDVLYHAPPAPPIVTIQIVGFRIDNTLNPGQDVWLKLWRVADPTVGVTAPHAILRCRAGKITEYAVQVDFGGGHLSYQVLITPGTKGTTAPTNAVRVALACLVSE